MSDRFCRNLNHPNEVLRFEKLTQEKVELGELTVGRTTAAPGWRWSLHVQPVVGGAWCKARHVGVVLSGRFGVTFSDGSSMAFGPGDAFDIPPEHDGYTIGEEDCVQIEWGGLTAFSTPGPGGARALATLLMTDIVSSTDVALKLGDPAWRSLLSAHFEAARTELDRFSGRVVKTTGDGLLATFEGPAQALQCAGAICRAAGRQSLSIRAAVHVGEVERVGSDVRGIALHETQRIMAEAGANEILVSELTRALAAASGFAFADRGWRQLKGLPDPYRLFALSH
jgi:class 3 adenylate cyclase